VESPLAVPPTSGSSALLKYGDQELGAHIRASRSWVSVSKYTLSKPQHRRLGPTAGRNQPGHAAQNRLRRRTSFLVPGVRWPLPCRSFSTRPRVRSAVAVRGTSVGCPGVGAQPPLWSTGGGCRAGARSRPSQPAAVGATTPSRAGYFFMPFLPFFFFFATGTSLLQAGRAPEGCAPDFGA